MATNELGDRFTPSGVRLRCPIRHPGALKGKNVLRRIVDGAAHFPWFENPAAVRAALRELAEAVLTNMPH